MMYNIDDLYVFTLNALGAIIKKRRLLKDEITKIRESFHYEDLKRWMTQRKKEAMVAKSTPYLWPRLAGAI
jgi:hypothetical protein